ncbi:MAG TPA: Fur family transcriptional regulator [Aeromicrobium sp.]|nr:Fur family transcriptional regulator [Aeromicrobium sp.]
MADIVRPTRQRQIVADALAELETFCSAQEIHALLNERGESVGLATVYRTLQLFAESGHLDALRGDDGETRYRQCSTGHHHHLVCRSCGRTVEVEGPTVERWADRVASEHGFTDVSHTLEIFGTCEDCARSVDRR